jgi:hypothetical protein
VLCSKGNAAHGVLYLVSQRSRVSLPGVDAQLRVTSQTLIVIVHLSTDYKSLKSVFFNIYPGHTKRAISVYISTDGRHVVSLAKDSLIKVI